MKTFLLGLVVLASCTSSSGKDDYIAGFSPPPAAKGYQRFITPTVTDIQPGDDQMYCQWIAPADMVNDRQIDDTLGYQSVGGHHVALYATTEIEPIGTSRICTTRDMLTVTFVGAVGAEGLSAAKLPDGMAFTVPAGSALMTNTHYINATDSPIDAQSVVDVKFGDPAHPLQPVGFLADSYQDFNIPPGVYTADTYCKANRDLSFFMWGNHMHEWGMKTMSEIIRGDGSHVPMQIDDSWSKDKTFNPNWAHWDVADPFLVTKGDVFHVRCTWNNTTSSPITFPVEMCVSTGFTLEEMPQSICDATSDPANPGT